MSAAENSLQRSQKIQQMQHIGLPKEIRFLLLQVLFQLSSMVAEHGRQVFPVDLFEDSISVANEISNMLFIRQ